MKSNRIALVIGVALLVFAWISAASIPKRADVEYSKQWEDADEPAFRASHVQIIANTMQLRNFYIGAAGLVCLGCGVIAAARKQSSQG